VLVVHGELDLAAPPEWGRELARLTGGRYLEVPNTGHVPMARRPVIFNLALREFAESLEPA
jgi:pimeloyl-ACP methyl ester carboxylesterase